LRKEICGGRLGIQSKGAVKLGIHEGQETGKKGVSKELKAGAAKTAKKG